jgi:hypothetical protein
MLKAHIIRILAGAPKSGVMLTSLKVELSVRMGRPAGDAEFTDEVLQLVVAGLCSSGRDEFTRDATLALTAAGHKKARSL